ncbi:hypothetical protein CAPTEDRAFT_226695 [Capitella teleta]|uniref:FERM domain-containing protein n=1 Tax=Capitella teleta TaxID=283909 RepID=R7TW08_CAPTE|nr:hypothetical protein CAPTEDRAFT_226695 [Capitella teleta]|eukprot:ELT97767.1 hypothetical protein CAPTEDRAFT_226695 [Capitella teleta]
MTDYYNYDAGVHRRLRMDAYLAAIRPKQLNTFSQDFRPQSYDLLLTEELNLGTDQAVKCLPMTKLSFEEEPSDYLCAFLHELTGNNNGGLKGKRAVFIPAAESEPVSTLDSSGIGTLYCVAVDSRNKLLPKYVNNLPDSPGFYPFDQVLETLTTNPGAYGKLTRTLLLRLFHWFRQKDKVPGAMNLLFSTHSEERLKRSITNPAYFTDMQFACLNGTESAQLNEGYSQTIANEALTKMLEIEKCDIIKINSVFGQDQPFKSKVDAYSMNRFWGMGRPEYSKMAVPSEEKDQWPSILSEIRDPSHVDEFPLHKCALEGDTEGILALLKSGLSVEQRDRESWAPIHHAAWFGHLEAMEVLLTKGKCDPNITNDNGSTPLHLAASKGRCYVVELLLNFKDINLNAVDNCNKTALNLCENIDKPDLQAVAQLLRSAMSKPTPTIKVLLMDGTNRMLNLVSGANTTVLQLQQQMMQEIEIPENCADVFTIWICSRNLQLQLKPEHKPIQHLNDWKRKIVQLLTSWDPSREDAQLFWRRHASLSMTKEKMVRHPVAIRLLFYEAYHNYINSYYPCSTQDAVILGGILLQLNHGDYDSRKARNIIVSESALKSLIPGTKKSEKNQNWSKELLTQYKAFSQRMINRNRSVQVLQHQFLKICWNLTVYGSAFFTGKVNLKNARQLTEVFIGINDIGIHIIVVPTKNMLQTFSYDTIEWLHDKENEMLVIQMKELNKGGMQIKTRQAGLVKHLMDKLSQLNTLALTM